MAGILQITGLEKAGWQTVTHRNLENVLQVVAGKQVIAELGMVNMQELKRFDIKQPVCVADFNWEALLQQVADKALKVKELPKQLPVRRDLAMVVSKSLPYSEIEATVKKVKLDKLQAIQLFDIFESEKLGAGKKSMALSFTFLDNEKTPTDKEIDGMMNRIMTALEKELEAEIRK